MKKKSASSAASPRSLLGFLVYAAAAWVSVALVGYGLALNAYERSKSERTIVAASAPIDWRWSWGFGFFGDTCFTLQGNGEGPFCVSPDYLLKGKNHAGNLYSLLKPGTPVSVKANAGRVVELTLYPESLERKRQIVEYGAAISRVQAELQQSQSGAGSILLGLLVLPALLAFRRVGMPRLKARLSS